MKRGFRLLIIFLLALAAVPFLPLYIEWTLMRSWRVDRLGDEITWGWRICTLADYWSNYTHQTREQDPAFWLKVNVVLAVLYALLIAIIVDGLVAWRKRRKLRVRTPPACS